MLSSKAELQEFTNRLDETSTEYGMEVSKEKSKKMKTKTYG